MAELIPQEKHLRAERLRKLRNLANLSREEISEVCHVKYFTYIGWETPKHGGLSPKGAKSITAHIHKAGVKCEFNWLYFGTGKPPAIGQSITQSASKIKSENIKEKTNSELIHLQDEIKFLQTIYQRFISVKVEDDSMLPFYEHGDYVGGIKLTGKQIKRAIGKKCIIGFNNKLLVRKLQLTKNKELVLSYTNYDSKTANNIIIENNIEFAAPIIWHRQLYRTKNKN